MTEFKLAEGVEMPKYETEGASGKDVIAHSIIKVFKGDQEVVGDKLEKVKQSFADRGYIKLRPFERILFGTGITVADMDSEEEIQVRSRSGVALKRGLIVANSPGTVDADYRGQIGVIILNSTPFLNKVEKGERIAQIVHATVIRPYVEQVTDVTETARGEGGYGSTNITK